MQLEEYFDFLSPDDIRIHKHRIGIESILYEYIHRHRTPEQIQRRFPTLGLEQVYATILYYLHNTEDIGAYLEDWLEHGRRMREEQARNPSPGVLKLRELLRQRDEAGKPAR
ncbi:MAG: DUF433 domain-containing protein [Dehalococcoidia bacterium]